MPLFLKSQSFIFITTLVFFLLLNELKSSIAYLNTNVNNSFLSQRTTRLSLKIEPIDVDDVSLNKAANFMMDSFWLQPPHIIGSGDELSSNLKSNLVSTQVQDMNDRYGERIGKRLFRTSFLGAYDSDETLVGIVGIEENLLNVETKEIMSNKNSENKLKEALTVLRPKERRTLKGCSTVELCGELIPDFEYIATLNNLAVSPTKRRMGIGTELCKNVESITQKQWDHECIFLKVEAENDSARNLYEEKGYELVVVDKKATSLRLCAESGRFEEYPTEMLILKKSHV